jgi:hypothetical protein
MKEGSTRALACSGGRLVRERGYEGNAPIGGRVNGLCVWREGAPDGTRGGRAPQST